MVAHEVAHHVQNELGVLGQANRLRSQVSQAESNAISVRIELQADCLAGVWGNDLVDSLNAAEGATSTSYDFNRSELFGAEGAPRVFFRIEKVD